MWLQSDKKKKIKTTKACWHIELQVMFLPRIQYAHMMIFEKGKDKNKMKKEVINLFIKCHDIHLYIPTDTLDFHIAADNQSARQIEVRLDQLVVSENTWSNLK
jgi:hypothetical protein